LPDNGEAMLPLLCLERREPLKHLSWRRYVFALVAALLLLCACTPSTPVAPTPTPICLQESTNEIVSIDESGPKVFFSIQLPPCYAERTWATYPVLYWTYGGISTVQQTAEQLIQHDQLSPFILVVPIGVGDYEYGTQIIEQLVPYVDAHYRTYPDRKHRSIAGISTGADVAVRTAFRAPETFGRVGVISGGIVEYEQVEYAEWISRVPPEQWPAVLIDIGEQDALIGLAHNLAAVLDAHGVTYTFTQAPGGHNVRYWGPHMETYLQWLANDW
jgi:enterochelin esterase-like enzyme